MYKNLLKISLITMCAGLLLSAAAFAFTGFHYESLIPNTERETKTYTAKADTIKNIRVHSNCGFVRLENSNDDSVHIEYDLSKDIESAFDVAQDTLNIDYNHKGAPWYYTFQKGIFAGINIDSYLMTIKLPPHYQGSIDINADQLAADKDAVTIGGTITITADNGSSQIKNLSCTGLTITSDNGTVNISDITAHDGIFITNDNGFIHADKLAAQNIQLSSDNGSIKIENSAAPASADLTSDNGLIQFNNLKSQKITLLSNNGTIRGTVNGKESDYQIAITSKNGYANLSSHLDTARPYLLTAESENGNIDITFTD